MQRTLVHSAGAKRGEGNTALFNLNWEFARGKTQIFRSCPQKRGQYCLGVTSTFPWAGEFANTESMDKEDWLQFVIFVKLLRLGRVLWEDPTELSLRVVSDWGSYSPAPTLNFCPPECTWGHTHTALLLVQTSKPQRDRGAAGQRPPPSPRQSQCTTQGGMLSPSRTACWRGRNKW